MAAPISPGRFAALSVTLILLGLGALEGLVVVPVSMGHPWETLGSDLGVYLARTASWLAGDGLYLPRQLAGPYEVLRGDALYPPPVVLLVAPFVLGVPLVLWWVIPLVTIAVSLWRLRPAWWAWPILAAILVYPRTWIVLDLGNPVMWVFAAGIAGMAWGWPAVGVLLKPIFAPLAVVGIRHRSWWIVLGIAVVVSALFGSMWLDYARVIADARTTNLEYLLGELPIGIALGIGGLSGSLGRPRGMATRPLIQEPSPGPVRL